MREGKMYAVEVSQLVFGYTAEPVLTDVSFTVGEGSSCCITGENGSGKSTLLKLILGELKPREGSIMLFGKPALQLHDPRCIGYVPQAHVMDKVAFPTTCREMVSLGLYSDLGFIKIPRRRHFERAEAALADMGLAAYARVPFNELSGGQQQRVMITRALIDQPKLLVLDEPTAGVDSESKISFLELLDQIQAEQGITTLIVSHECELVSAHMKLDATWKMVDGRIVHAGV